MAWHLLEKLIEQVGQHSTLIGKFWTTFFFILRLLIVISIADQVWEEDQDHFVCNTLSPGCENVCYNQFNPVSLLTLWAIQILAVGLSSVMFIVYTAHTMARIEQAKEIKKIQEQQKVTHGVGDQEPPEYRLVPSESGNVMSIDRNDTEINGKNDVESKNKEETKKDGAEIVAAKLGNDNPPTLFLAYVAQVVMRLITEIIFIVIQLKIYVFQFYVPELFRCGRWPCPGVVDCFISRPKEKTFMLWIMFASTSIMIVLNVIELYHLGLRKIYTAWTTRSNDITKQYRSLKSDSPNFNPKVHHGKYVGGYPQAVGIRVDYARSSISGESDDGFHCDQFI
ncbi:gap junction beta-6 protein-like [Styela clava]